MIRSFACRETERIFNDEVSRKLPRNIQQSARRKLLLLHQARILDDLRVPPGNRLELLKGNRSGQHSIRVNNQWRICFHWANNEAVNVEIVDYH
ncbi:MAG TPA: type II toxin-antitoxin system RelE/ParE family toxin [Verrucomicrobiales bacterium]|nr:type II toxin-antitoxin system RelE/ParE family toxin [Verrucomicrobiales bacterium]